MYSQNICKYLRNNISLHCNVSLNATGLNNRNKILSFIFYGCNKNRNFQHNGLVVLSCQFIILPEVPSFIKHTKYSPSDFFLQFTNNTSVN